MSSASPRRKLIAGNWKMNGSTAANEALLRGIHTYWQQHSDTPPSCDVLICPPSPYFQQLSRSVFDFADSIAIQIGAQDISSHVVGAYTGECSAAMLQDFGMRWTIVGHSERRQYHNESDVLVASKAQAALRFGVCPIVCVGETLAQRDAGETLLVVQRQLSAALSLLGREAAKIVVAYEPVWAIGTGRTATPAQAQAVHAALRSQLSAVGAGNVRILYGGSMNAGNAAELLGQADIDGGLIGGAALKAPDFVAIIAAACGRPVAN
jgi:triosephosphate isomerase (TIM)